MTNKAFVKKLNKLNACEEAIKFVQDNNYTLKQAWNNCERADWMLWLACEIKLGTRQERIHAICDCAETALRYIPKNEDRPKKAIYWARVYADNRNSHNLEKLHAAGGAAWAAAKAAAEAAAGAAAGAAARAAAEAAAGAAARAAAEAAAGAAAGGAAWAAAHKNMCILIRKRIKV